VIEKTFDFNNPIEIQRELKKSLELMSPHFGGSENPVMDSLLHAFSYVLAAQNAAMEEYTKKIHEDMVKAFAIPAHQLGQPGDDIYLDKNGNLTIQKHVKVNTMVDFVPIKIHIGGVDKAECSHQWTEYVGLREAFTYCKKCDVKHE